MKAVLISIRPRFCSLIARGAKPLEIRKTCPKLSTPFKCYIYCTKPGTSDPNEVLETHDGEGNIHRCNGKVIGEFVCDRLVPIRVFDNGSIQFWSFYNLSRSCLSYDELANYIGNGKKGYGWQISDLVIYDKPKELAEFFFPPEKFCEKQYCGGCPKEQTPDAYGDYYFDCEWKRTIMRPPQSWCYVEELGEEAET